MAKGHWLDPLARSLLEVTGQIRRATEPRRPESRETESREPESRGDDSVERDLLALKLAQNPGLRLRSAEEVRQAAALGWRLDVNRATAADWLRLPGCSPSHVDLLLRLQSGGVQLSGTEDLQNLLHVDGELIRSWTPLLEFRWYGEPPPARPAPLDLNRCRAEQLGAQLALEESRCRRLLQERSRAPFRDLADLQQRLQLPAELVEGLIGRVCFGQGPIGPELPRPPRPPASR
jgi:DNA uptake protein ComE-like DNA-binding protein